MCLCLYELGWIYTEMERSWDVKVTTNGCAEQTPGMTLRCGPSYKHEAWCQCLLPQM